ncbi:hypothetical protein OG361_02645 [Streptomyces sp. NBC_00090]|uniref:hypothetical protein n=1 Tax=Streptomyces sp. NBC_00090 TaxID=2903619 RepID=UPI003249B3DB
MKKRPRQHDEYVSGVRVEPPGAYGTDTAGQDGDEQLLCPFCRALEHADAEVTRRETKDAE